VVGRRYLETWKWCVSEERFTQKGGRAMNHTSGHSMSGVSLCAAVITAVFLFATPGAEAKGGSPSWHGLTYHGAMLGTHGAFACDPSVRALARAAARVCRTRN
jgi:hypothetical protein